MSYFFGTIERTKRVLPVLLAVALLVPQLAVAQQASPTITSLSPQTVAAGSRIVVTGSGFTSLNTVHFSGGASATAQAASGTGLQLATTVPTSLPSGEYQIHVETLRGQRSNTVSLNVTGGAEPSDPGETPPVSSDPLPPSSPTLTAVSPSTIAPGQRIVLTGRGFGSFNQVQFAGPQTTTVTGASQTGQSIAVSAPTFLAGGNYAVSVATRGQTTNQVALTVIAQTTPSPTPVPTTTIQPTPTVTPQPDPSPFPQPCFFDFLFCPPATHTYLALGDSIAAGAGAFKGYVPRYADGIEDALNIRIRTKNFSRGGWESSDLLHALRTISGFQEAAREADIITWNIGGNELKAARDQYRAGNCGGADNQDCLRHAVTEFRTNWDAIADEILQQRKSTAVAVRTMDIYYPFVREDQSRDSWTGDNAPNDFVVLKGYVVQVNSHIAASSTARGIPYAGAFAAFNGSDGNTDPEDLGYIAGIDNFHPNDRGHTVLVDLLGGLGYAELGQAAPQPTPQPTVVPSPAPTIRPLPTFGPQFPPFPGQCPAWPQCVLAYLPAGCTCQSPNVPNRPPTQPPGPLAN